MKTREKVRMMLKNSRVKSLSHVKQPLNLQEASNEASELTEPAHTKNPLFENLRLFLSNSTILVIPQPTLHEYSLRG